MAGPATTQSDVLVIFGITGDLAKKMTFRSLYRLERRGMIDCPIVGVARDEWSAATLREHARKAIEDGGEMIDEDVFQRFAERLSMVSGDYTDPRPTSGWPGRSKAATLRSSTSRSRPRCSAGWSTVSLPPT